MGRRAKGLTLKICTKYVYYINLTRFFKQIFSYLFICCSLVQVNWQIVYFQVIESGHWVRSLRSWVELLGSKNFKCRKWSKSNKKKLRQNQRLYRSKKCRNFFFSDFAQISWVEFLGPKNFKCQVWSKSNKKKLRQNQGQKNQVSLTNMTVKITSMKKGFRAKWTFSFFVLGMTGMQLLFPFFLLFCFPIMTRLIFFYFFSLSCSTTAADAAAILRSLQEVLIMI